MRLWGSNARFGAERVDLSERRWVLPLVPADDGDGGEPAFPLGTGGLLPVVTERKGAQKVTYAFPVGEGSAGAEPADAATRALGEAVELVNRLLTQAAELARHDFGYVDGIEVGVPEGGSGYTRATVVPLDAHGQPSEAPLHLALETVPDPGTPDSLSATIEYDPQGGPRRVVMTEYGTRGYTCRVLATVNAKTGRLSVQKVEESDDRGRRGHLLYKRGWEPRDGHS